MITGQVIGTVTHKENITPHFIRVYMKVDDAEQFRRTTIGENKKITIFPHK